MPVFTRYRSDKRPDLQCKLYSDGYCTLGLMCKCQHSYGVVGTPEWIAENPTDYLYGLLRYSIMYNKDCSNIAVDYLKSHTLLDYVDFEPIVRLLDDNRDRLLEKPLLRLYSYRDAKIAYTIEKFEGKPDITKEEYLALPRDSEEYKELHSLFMGVCIDKIKKEFKKYDDDAFLAVIADFPMSDRDIKRVGEELVTLFGSDYPLIHSFDAQFATHFANSAEPSAAQLRNRQDRVQYQEPMRDAFVLPADFSITEVNSLEELAHAVEVMKKEGVLGWDTESAGCEVFRRLALIQISTASQAWLISPTWMQQESRTAELNALWESVVQNPHIIHAFKTVGGDSREMQAAFPALHALHAFTNVVDVDVLSEGLGFTRRAGLSAYVELFDGRPLDKRMQCSRWARRPLTREQRVYAATDAFVTRMVLLEMCKTLKAGKWGLKERRNWALAERRMVRAGTKIPMNIDTGITIKAPIKPILDLYDSVSAKLSVCCSNECTSLQYQPWNQHYRTPSSQHNSSNNNPSSPSESASFLHSL
ncbi:hypothetical protein WA577_002071 [Blastocystis sp. JDR]